MCLKGATIPLWLHAGRVTGVAFDDNLVVSGCNQGSVRIWGMDDLKCARSVRTAHDGSVAGAVCGEKLLAAS